MVGEPDRIDERIVVGAPPQRVWAALTGPGEPSWWPGMALDARLGGSFREVWTEPGGPPQVTSGRVVRCTPPTELTLTWQDEGWPAPTMVTFRLEPFGGGDRTRLGVVHEGWEAVSGDPAVVQALVAAHRDGWRHHLGAWAAHAEQPPS